MFERIKKLFEAKPVVPKEPRYIELGEATVAIHQVDGSKNFVTIKGRQFSESSYQSGETYWYVSRAEEQVKRYVKESFQKGVFDIGGQEFLNASLVTKISYELKPYQIEI